jgi:hypothetical protein
MVPGRLLGSSAAASCIVVLSALTATHQKQAILLEPMLLLARANDKDKICEVSHLLTVYKPLVVR